MQQGNLQTSTMRLHPAILVILVILITLGLIFREGGNDGPSFEDTLIKTSHEERSDLHSIGDTRVQPLQGFPADNASIDELFQNLSRHSSNVSDERRCNFEDRNLSSIRQSFNDAPFIETEQGLINHHSEHVRSHFFPIPHFDDESSGVKGGVALFKDAFIQGDYFNVFDCNVVYFQGGCQNLVHLVNKNSFSIKSVTTPGFNIVRLHTAVLISQYWGNQFYHSMVEDLPRIALVIEFLKAHPQATIISYHRPLMTNNQHNHFFKPLWGLPTHHPWVHYDGMDKAFHVERLLVPTATGCLMASPAAVAKFQESFRVNSNKTLSAAWNQSPNPNRTIIVVQKRTHRFLTNHNKMVKALQQKFRKCCQIIEFFGNETMQHAAALHNSASIVIGPHGAGLSHLIFMKRNESAMIEIQAKTKEKIKSKTNYGPEYQTVRVCHQYTAKAAGIVSRLLLMNKTIIPFDDSYAVENISLVLETTKELLGILSNVKKEKNMS